MPGMRLSNKEKAALEWWEKENTNNLLESISIESPSSPGLRGITSAEITFRYPVTVISGKNGSGKSTLLALSVLAFHRTGDTAPRLAKNGKHYTFNDFFFKGPADPPISGVTIKWTYKGNAKELEIEKNTNKWMHYERRPEKYSEYIGISRCVPAFEQSVLRQHFSSSKSGQKSEALNEKWRQRLSNILGINYKSAEEKISKKYKIRQCSSEQSYSSFNMGAGEDIALELLAAICSAPEHSLIAIEELEMGLHPSAQKEIALLLPEIALEKKCQIVLTSHSEHIIDNLPREARVLISKNGNTHNANYNVSTTYALGEMLSQFKPEVKIFCEDPLCRQIIQNCLTNKQRKRASIISAGADSELLNHAWAHTISGERHKTLVIWDGEVTQKKIRDWYKSINAKQDTYNSKHGVNDIANIMHLKLPGDTPPEKWIIDTIESSQDAIEKIKEKYQLTYSSDVTDILNKAKIKPNHHSLFFVFKEELGIPESEIKVFITQLITEIHKTELNAIQNCIDTLLNN